MGGGAPLLKGIRRWSVGRKLVEWFGVLNGTTNFVLDRISGGDELEDAVELARQAGLAESNPVADLSGADAACKLVILARIVTGRWTPPVDVASRNLDKRSVERARGAVARGRRLRQLARARYEKGALRLSVQLVEFPENSLAGRCHRHWNVLAARADDGQFRTFRGKGAGRWPTAQSMMADLFELSRETSGVDPRRTDPVLVGRIRPAFAESLDCDRRCRDWSFLVCGDQLRKGAALNALQILDRIAGRTSTERAIVGRTIASGEVARSQL